MDWVGLLRIKEGKKEARTVIFGRGLLLSAQGQLKRGLGQFGAFKVVEGGVSKRRVWKT